MKIRSKLLILLLTIALLPLVAGTAWQRFSTQRLGRRLAANTRQTLVEGATRTLEMIVRNYGQIVSRDKKAVELIVGFQALGVEERLRAAPPSGVTLFFSRDYDEGRNLPTGMKPSEMHFRTGADGRQVPIPVTYDEQVFFKVRGVADAAVADDMARLSAMPAVYGQFHATDPGLLYWQYTSLAVGFHTSYPGHGGYPPEYDPRTRLWYQRAKEAGDLVWVVMPEVSTRTVALTAAMPVKRPDGRFAGVTAVDVAFDRVFRALDVPSQWREDAEVLLAVPQGDKLLILVQSAYLAQGANWETPTDLVQLDSDDSDEFEQFRIDAAAGRGGVRRMRYKGRDAFWAYGLCRDGQPFPVVIVPYDRVVARAEEAEQQVIEAMLRGLEIAGAGIALVVAVVVLVAFRSSQAVTRPVRRLAHAAERFAAGDYSVHVDIKTGDELQDLGDTVNDVGPKMLEREQMKASLALAMEIQRHLLPERPPAVEGFDIAGNSIYCDETGGDYYDFIDLVDLGEGKLGIAIGDVTGHGIGAALLMASARAMLRSHATLHGDDLSDLFRTLNVHLVRDTGDERFMTLFYGVLDSKQRSLWWVSGGHDPAVLWRQASGAIEELGNTGMALGIIEEAEFDRAGPAGLEPGDVFLIGTDGAWETQNAKGELFGWDRFLEVFGANARKSSQEIYDAIVEALTEFRDGGPQADDITLVIVKVL